MGNDGAVRADRTAAARAAAGLVVGQACAVSDEEALLVPEWTGAGPFAAALVAALTFTWLLVQWRRRAARASASIAGCLGELRPWAGRLGARLSPCVGRWRERRPLPHRGRRRSC